jgi:guanylate kinase
MNKAVGNLFIVSAPSGAGKTSLVNAVVKALPNICLSVSHTTRPLRPGEQATLDYHFVTQPEFKKMLSENAFLEYAEVYGSFYGTSRLWVEETRRRGQDVILEIDWQGARQIRSQFLDVQSIFILPPSYDALAERLTKRHQDKPIVIEQRMRQAQQEIVQYTEYDYIICNDRFDDALEDLKTIIQSHRLRLGYQAIAQAERIEKLLS